LLGNPDLPRVSIVSFGIRHPLEARPLGMLHPNFVVALLGDLFGIQARSGCFCAGPYVHRLVGFDREVSAAHEAEVLRGQTGIKLGYVRLSFNYFLTETAFRYLVDAVRFVAEHGWKLLPLYRFDPASGLWSHRDGARRPAVTLAGLPYAAGELRGFAPRRHAPESVLPGYLEEARRIVRAVEASPPASDPEAPRLTPESERLRWFPLPEDALARLRSG
ncbi:MAG TPA: hypothetical protein VD704_13460, partial [Gaiellaceae bacterium]|nr:hypothetical protein [Gaiellaceae bacterium]